MAFLNNSRCELNQNASKDDARATVKASKGLDTEAAISRYFLACKSKKEEKCDGTPDDKLLDRHQRSKPHGSPPLVVDLPEKPFLGFGSNGANSVLPETIVKELDARCVPTISQRDTNPPSCSSGYLSWSSSAASSSLFLGQSKPHTKEPNPHCQSIDAERSGAFPDGLVVAGPSVERIQPVAGSLPLQMNASAARILPEQQSSPIEHLPIDQARLYEAEEVHNTPVSQPSNSRGVLCTNLPPANVSQVLGAKSIAHSPNEGGRSTQREGAVIDMSMQILKNKPAHDSLHNIFNTLVQPDKGKLTDTTARGESLGPQETVARSSSIRLEQLCQPEQAPNYSILDRSSLLQMQTRLGFQNDFYKSHEVCQEPCRIEVHNGSLHGNSLPAITNDNRSGRKHHENYLHPMRAPHLRVPHISKSTMGIVIPNVGYDLLFERQQEDRANVAGEARRFAHKMMNQIECHTNKDGPHRSLSNGLLEQENRTIDDWPEREHFRRHFDNATGKEPTEYYRSLVDRNDASDQAACYDILDTPPVLSAYYESQPIDPLSAYTGPYEHFHGQGDEATRSNSMGDINRLRSSNAFPEQDEDPENIFPARTMSLNRAWDGSGSDSRFHEETGILPQGFWRPNKLY